MDLVEYSTIKPLLKENILKEEVGNSLKKENMVYINDILESIDKIEEYVHDLSEEEFNTNTLIQDAVFRRLMIIGEAVKSIPMEVEDKKILKYHGKTLRE